MNWVVSWVCHIPLYNLCCPLTVGCEHLNPAITTLLDMEKTVDNDDLVSFGTVPMHLTEVLCIPFGLICTSLRVRMHVTSNSEEFDTRSLYVLVPPE